MWMQKYKKGYNMFIEFQGEKHILFLFIKKSSFDVMDFSAGTH